VDEERFSERHGFSPSAPEITVRHDAPHDLRGLIVDFAHRSGLDPHDVRSIVCDVLMTRPDEDNWSPFPNVDDEGRGLVDSCEWFEVYDVIEAFYAALSDVRSDTFAPEPDHCARDRFAERVNTFFVRKGIGWQLINGRVEVRGPESFETAVRPVVERLTEAAMPTAAQEIHEALSDLARRPKPDVTGAIQHSMAATECVARVATNDPKATLGEILEHHPGLIPKPVDDALKKMWGYASETARHLREGREPSFEEAELTVMTCAAAITYLEKKLS